LNTVGIIEARMGSRRFPGKVMAKIGSKESIMFLIDRLKISKKLNKVIVATSENKKDDELVALLKKNFIDYFRGSEKNVLERVYSASRKFKAEVIVELSGDSPFLDPEIIDETITFFHNNSHLDYINVDHNYPGGIGFQVFKYDTLKKCYYNSKTEYEKEHVTPYIKSNPAEFKSFYFFAPKKISFPNVKFLLDEKIDLEFLNKVVSKNTKFMNTEDLLHIVLKKNFSSINSRVQRTIFKA